MSSSNSRYLVASNTRVRDCCVPAQVFLCSLFAPVCLDRPVWPCRSLCEAVKAGCVDRMLKYGFPWPDMLRCDQFPSDNDLCIGLRTADTHGTFTDSRQLILQTTLGYVQSLMSKFNIQSLSRPKHELKLHIWNSFVSETVCRGH